MKTFIIQKIKNKKVLNACLLVGIVLLIAIISCTPMFQSGSLDMLIHTMLVDEMKEQNTYPFVLSRSAALSGESVSFDAALRSATSYEDVWESYLPVPKLLSQKHIWLHGESIFREYDQLTARWISLGCIPDMDDHVETLIRVDEKDVNKEAIPCKITESVMDAAGFFIGETIQFPDLKDDKGNPLVVQITEIIKEKEEDSYFWHVGVNTYESEFFVSEENLSKIVDASGSTVIQYEIYDLYDYNGVTSENVDDIDYYLSQFREKDKSFEDNIRDLLAVYCTNREFVKIICWVLELPIIVLLLAFIYMIISQILGMESGEISMLASRGFSRIQIMKLYLGQSAVLCAAGLVIGLPLSYLLCKVAALANGFLQFVIKDTSAYHFRPVMIVYGVVAALFVMLFVTVPVAFYAKDSTVERRSRKNNTKGKKYTGLIVNGGLLLVSLYMLFNYNKQKDILAMSVLSGKSLDPVIFLNVTLFLFACGMLGLMLLQAVVKLVFRIGEKKWKPHTYAALLQIVRSDGRSRFISVFLIFTISMGILDANVAGTINRNNEERISYDMGADVVFEEQWTTRKFYVKESMKVVRYYVEPDYQRYQNILGDKVSSMTRVVRDNKVSVMASGNTLANCTMLAVNTKEFGETADLKDGLNEEHWFHLLNALAKTGSGVLISSNLAKELDLSVGDSIRYTRYNEFLGKGEEGALQCTGKICGIFDAFPSSNRYAYEVDENGEGEELERYGIITNYAYAVNSFGDMPYEIWMRLNKGVSAQEVYSAIRDADVNVKSFTSQQEEMEKMHASSMIQITNGLFSLSFLVSIILCTIGFLIYWITSMKQREMLLGIYRAMGMSYGEVSGMLRLEQLFSSLFSGVLGGITGMVASLLHTGIIAIVYLPKKHDIPLHTVLDVTNLGGLMLLLCIMVVICLGVMRRQVRNLNIVSAIKMGDD